MLLFAALTWRRRVNAGRHGDRKPARRGDGSIRPWHLSSVAAVENDYADDSVPRATHHLRRGRRWRSQRSIGRRLAGGAAAVK